MSPTSASRRRPRGVALALLAVLPVLAVTSAARSSAGQPDGRRHDVTVAARKFVFEPATIEVNEGDLVRVTLRADDIAHSLTIDEYRIAKRASPDRPVTFEFQADRAGTFKFYCSLQIDEGCRRMQGTLIVHPR